MLLLLAILTLLCYLAYPFQHYRFIATGAFGCAFLFRLANVPPNYLFWAIPLGALIGALFIRTRPRIVASWHESILPDDQEPLPGQSATLSISKTKTLIEVNGYFWPAVWAGTNTTPPTGTTVVILQKENNLFYVAAPLPTTASSIG